MTPSDHWRCPPRRRASNAALARKSVQRAFSNLGWRLFNFEQAGALVSLVSSVLIGHSATVPGSYSETAALILSKLSRRLANFSLSLCRPTTAWVFVSMRLRLLRYRLARIRQFFRCATSHSTRNPDLREPGVKRNTWFGQASPS